MWTDNEKGKQVVVENVIDSDEEAYFVANKIEELISKGHKLSDFAILYRTNTQSRAFEEVFMRRNISYRIVGGLRFYDRKEIKDIIAYLRLIQNPIDDISLKRIINVPKRGIGNVTLERIERYANETSKSLYSTILDIDKIPGISKRTKDNLKTFTHMIDSLSTMKESMNLKEFIESIIYKTGYAKELQAEDSIESQTRLDNIMEFISVAVDFEVTSPEGNLEDFLAKISLLSDVDKTADIDNTVTLLTVHSAKGLEFPVVFMVGMEEELFPIARAVSNESQLEEERRLCYVAMTRAEKLLYITHARIRTIYGRTSYTLPSRFIKEIPIELLSTPSRMTKSEPRDKRERLIKVLDFSNNIKDAKPKKMIYSEKIKEGTKINHDKWGIGTIVQIKDRDDDKEVMIAFEKVGLKRLLLSIAPIEIAKGE